MLRDRERVRTLRLPIPPGDARETVRNIFDFDVEGGRIEEIERRPLSMRCQALLVVLALTIPSPPWSGPPGTCSPQPAFSK